MSVEITAGARLHFGLLDVAAPFGGCGVMIDGPATRVRVGHRTRFVCEDGIHRERIDGIVDRWVAHEKRSSRPNVAVEILEAAPPHNGLGSGTQMSLAIAMALVSALQPSRADDRAFIMSLADRGRRSAVGSHGFFEPGFIVEGLRGCASEEAGLNPVDHKIALPNEWRVGVVLPEQPAAVPTVSGQDEVIQFDALQPADDATRANLVAMLSGEMIPAAEVGDFDSFTDALTRYNRASGNLFAAVQGGPYNGPFTTRLIDQLLHRGHRGVGQSSWGPGVFVWFADVDQANRAKATWRKDFAGTRLLIQSVQASV